MKKLLIATGIAALAFATLAGAQGYMFSANLTVGSTGPDVVALQTWLINSGYSIPAIASGAAAKGYFGSQTKTAVQAYQAAHGVPNTGFVGPLTRAALNGGTTVATGACPAGYTCTANNVVTPVCPVGYTCTQTGTTVPPTGTPGVISTPNVVGTLTNSLWSTPSGIVAYKGQSYDVAAYKVQASASDMAIQNLTLDFDTRLWLYASTITIKDDSGAVVGQVSGLNQSSFSELTVGSLYRVSVPVNGYVVRATQTKYLTVNISFLPTSDRSTGTINVVQSQIRSVDGTGVTDTQTSTGGARSFSYQGSGAGQLITTISANNPPQGFIEISTSAPTEKALLAVYSLKSQNTPSMLRSLVLDLSISGNGNTNAIIPNIFAALSLKVGDVVVTNGTLGTVTGTAGGYQHTRVTFENLSINLPADTYLDVSILGRIAQSATDDFEGVLASTTLDLTTSTNIDVEDASYARITPNSISLAGNIQQLTTANVGLAGMPSVSYGTAINNTSTGSTTQQFTFTLPLVAGKNAIYISNNVYAAIATSTNPTGMTIRALSFSDNDTSGDGSTYFYLAPGQAKTLTAVYSASGLTSAGGVVQLQLLVYGVDSSASGRYLVSPPVSNILKAVLFH